MEEKGYCNLRMSTVSRFGRTQHMKFGDFLKYNEKKLVSGIQEVIFEINGKKIKFKNPKIMNLPNNHDTWKEYVPSNLNDFAVFVFGGERRPMIIDFHLSTYLRTLLRDDLQAGQNIHTFDLKFSNEYQAKKGFSVEGAGLSISNDLDKPNKYQFKEIIRLKSNEEYGIFFAKIVTHRSVSLDEYIKETQSDPVWRLGLKEYFDPLMYSHYKEKYGLGNHLDTFREECDVPL